jgi:UDP-N-acetylglucosamine:LPS N-acetylglucosamine transferase
VAQGWHRQLLSKFIVVVRHTFSGIETQKTLLGAAHHHAFTTAVSFNRSRSSKLKPFSLAALPCMDSWLNAPAVYVKLVPQVVFCCGFAVLLPVLLAARMCRCF